MTRILADRAYKLLFHLLFWGLLLVLPMVIRPRIIIISQEVALAQMLIVAGTSVPLFFLNSDYLIPKVLPRKGSVVYMIYLALLLALSVMFASLLRAHLLPLVANGSAIPPFPSAFPVIFVAAISTAYGLVVYFNEQEKAKAIEMQQYQAQQAERLQSELAFLRSQISPHFIFNVLNSLTYLIHTNSPEAKSVVVKLADLLRYMLYESDDTRVGLTKEIDYLKNYIDLQQMRFADDVDVRVHLQCSEHGSIEPMLLIPFVENAFKHGIASIQDPFVEVRLHCNGETLCFEVQNRNNAASTSTDTLSGIGLRNVRRRLELLYPQSHQLAINDQGGLYQVILQLTIKQDELHSRR
jgi:two-component system, LytTR family, sensor kinase